MVGSELNVGYWLAYDLSTRPVQPQERNRTSPPAEWLEQRNVDRLDIQLTAQDQPYCFLSMESGLLLRWIEDTITEPMMTLRPRSLSE